MTKQSGEGSHHAAASSTVQDRQAIEEAARAFARAGDPGQLSQHLVDQIVNMCAHLETDWRPILEALRANLEKRLTP
jgi:hypothetical protein